MRNKRSNKLTIKSILRSEFDRLLPRNSAMESLMVEQVEWRSDGSGTILGAIAKGAGVAGWNYVILERDEKGDFHIRKVMANFFNLKAARVDLVLWMKEIKKSNHTNPGTSDSWLPPVPAELPPTETPYARLVRVAGWSNMWGRLSGRKADDKCGPIIKRTSE